jgi:transposase-like protein
MSQITKVVAVELAAEGCREAAVRLPAVKELRSEHDKLVRLGVRQMLQAAIEAECQWALKEYQRRAPEMVRVEAQRRNGRLPGRSIMTGAGPLEVSQPRVRDNSPEGADRVQLCLKILPPHLRRSQSINELIPWLYLKGISTGDFGDALQALVGDQASGLSAGTVVRLKEQWSAEYEQWCRRNLRGKRYGYLWVDGIHVNVRLEDDAGKRQSILVVMGATVDGTKELVAVADGYRESEQSWYELLLGLKLRGMTSDSLLAIGDGALGFWAAIRKVFPRTREQWCWVHKTANVLNKMPKSLQAKAKSDLHEIWMAETRAAAQQAFDHFLEKFGTKYESACACLKRDRDVLLTFYDYPAEHWKHLRTTNPIESPFATIRLRHRRTKGSGTRRTSLATMLKLGQSAEKHRRKLNGCEQITLLIQGQTFVDGVLRVAA